MTNNFKVIHLNDSDEDKLTKILEKEHAMHWAPITIEHSYGVADYKSEGILQTARRTDDYIIYLRRQS